MRIQIADRTYLPLSERPDPASPTTEAVPFMTFVEDEFFLPWTEAQHPANHHTRLKRHFCVLYRTNLISHAEHKTGSKWDTEPRQHQEGQLSGKRRLHSVFRCRTFS